MKTPCRRRGRRRGTRWIAPTGIVAARYAGRISRGRGEYTPWRSWSPDLPPSMTGSVEPARGCDRWACGRRERHRGLLRRDSRDPKTPLRRYVADCLGRSGKSSRILANRSSHHRCHPLVARPTTGASSCRSMTIATSFKPRPTNCPRSIFTASDHCHMPGHDKAAGPPDSERLRAQTRKPPRRTGEAGGRGKAWCGPGDRSTRLTSRSSAR
jgi:hypothetical protein